MRIEQQKNQQKLESLQAKYDSEAKQIERAYQEAVKLINSLVLTEKEARKAGFDSLLELQKYYLEKSFEQYLEALNKTNNEDKDFWTEFAKDLEDSTTSF